MQKNTIVFVGEYDSCVDGGSFALPEEWTQQLGDDRCVGIVPEIQGDVRCLNIVPAGLMPAGTGVARIGVDSHGHIAIDDTLLDAVGITDRVKLVGALRIIKAFAPEMFAQFGGKPDVDDSVLEGIFDAVFDEHPESSEESKAVRQDEDPRKRIAELESVVATQPKDVAALTELMRLYRGSGETVKCGLIMRRLRDIPSRVDVREAAKEFFAIVDTFSDGERVDIDKLRRQFGSIFEIVESRQEIRPADIMAATGCGCSFAIDVLKAFARLGIVSKDLSLGLRKVFDCRNLHWMTIYDEDAMCQGDLPPRIVKHYDDALTAVRKAGECKVSVIMRKTGLGYNSSAALADYINHHTDWRKYNVRSS